MKEYTHKIKLVQCRVCGADFSQSNSEQICSVCEYQRLNMLSRFEREIIDLQIDRLLEGQKKYGTWRCGDKRDLLAETCEELLDAAQYLSAKILELKRKSNV